MTRLLIAISIVAFFVVINGRIGAVIGILIVAIIGAFFPAGRHQEEGVRMSSDGDDSLWEKIEPARRGSEVDPTRPHDDAHPLLLTNQIRRSR